jgi:hypothetical protein
LLLFGVLGDFGGDTDGEVTDLDGALEFGDAFGAHDVRALHAAATDLHDFGRLGLGGCSNWSMLVIARFMVAILSATIACWLSFRCRRLRFFEIT